MFKRAQESIGILIWVWVKNLPNKKPQVLVHSVCQGNPFWGYQLFLTTTATSLAPALVQGPWAELPSVRFLPLDPKRKPASKQRVRGVCAVKFVCLFGRVPVSLACFEENQKENLILEESPKKRPSNYSRVPSPFFPGILAFQKTSSNPEKRKRPALQKEPWLKRICLKENKPLEGLPQLVARHLHQAVGGTFSTPGNGATEREMEGTNSARSCAPT